MCAGKTHCASVITSTSTLIRTTQNRGATAKELLDETHSQWRIKNRDNCGDGDSDDVPSETSLPNLNSFKGKCFHCGEVGHRANEYPKKISNNNQNSGRGSRWQGHCNHCGKKGHKETFYWEKEENECLRPVGYKTRAEKEKEGQASSNEVLVSIVDEQFIHAPDNVEF